MSSFKHILVPTDFGPASAEALETALTLASKFDSEVTLLHVWEIPVYPYMEFVLDSAELVASVERAATARLAEALGQARQSLPRTRSLLQMGSPWQQIIDLIPTVKADLIIMGTHGRRGFSHALLGSVAEKVVRLSQVPVLTVHTPASDGHSSG